MNPILGQVTLALILAVLLLPRRWAALAVVSGVIYVTQGHLFTVAGVDFTPIRFITLTGFIRVVIIRKEFSFAKLNNIDKSLLIFCSVSITIFALRSQLTPSLSSTMSYRGGLFFDSLFSYLTFRGLLKDLTEFKQFAKDMVILIIPFTILIVLEGITGRNFFNIMGGVPETPTMREGYYRCQASFRHAITAGSFGATLAPLFIGLAAFRDTRFRAIIGIILALSITIASHSSSPLMALLSAFIAWMCWPLRERMRMVRWAIVFSLFSLHIVMKAPVWFIYARISDIIGGHGWFRANLIDQFINNFGDWWLIGIPIEQTRNWAATWMPWGGVDVTNEYISIGINGGLISLILFIWLLKVCYSSLGKAMKKIRVRGENGRLSEILLWGIGCALTSHAINLSSATYFDQFWVMWYMLLAVISGVTKEYLLDDSQLSLEASRP